MSTIKVDTITTLDGTGNITASRPMVVDISSVTGTLPMARLSGTLPALNGSALTALNATQLTSGTIPIARIADDAVTTAKIAPDAITAAKIADDVINSEHYAAASIDNEHLADDAVGVAELSATGTASSSTFLRGDNAWATPSGGKILQVVHNSTTTNYTVGSGDADVTNLNAVITPSATTSTILLLVRTHFYYAGSDSGWSMTIRRTVGGSNTDVYSDSTAYAYYGESGATNRRGELSLNYKDSPSTTSAITYQIRARKNSGTITLNENSIGSVTAFEIGA